MKPKRAIEQIEAEIAALKVELASRQAAARHVKKHKPKDHATTAYAVVTVKGRGLRTA